MEENCCRHNPPAQAPPRLLSVKFSVMGSAARLAQQCLLWQTVSASQGVKGSHWLGLLASQPVKCQQGQHTPTPRLLLCRSPRQAGFPTPSLSLPLGLCLLRVGGSLLALPKGSERGAKRVYREGWWVCPEV